jgi:hypothetical protein
MGARIGKGFRGRPGRTVSASSSVFQSSDIVYKGCFRVPDVVAPSGVLAGRVVNDQLRFFMSSSGTQGSALGYDGFVDATIASGASTTVFTLSSNQDRLAVNNRISVKRAANGNAIPEFRTITDITGAQITVNSALGGIPAAGDTIRREGDEIYEFADPGTYSLDYTQAPTATILNYWGDIYQGRRCTWRQNTLLYPLQYQILASLYWHEGNQLLYWGYYDAYNATGETDWAFGATALTTPNGSSTVGDSTAYGPWRTYHEDMDGHERYGGASSAMLTMAPDGTIGGAGAYFNVREWSWGPMLLGGAAWPTSATASGLGAADLTLSDSYLQYFYMGAGGYNVTNNYFNLDGSVNGAFRSFQFPLTPNRNYQFCQGPEQLDGSSVVWSDFNTAGRCSWNQSCGVGPGVWVDLGTKKGVFFAAKIGGSTVQDPESVDAAHIWYFNNFTAPECLHGIAGGYPNTDTIAGPVSTANVAMLMIYNPDDLTAAKTGAVPPYAPQPNTWIDVETTYNARVAPKFSDAGTTLPYSHHLGAMYFDSRRNYLFVMAAQADNSTSGLYKPLVHVFQLNP